MKSASTLALSTVASITSPACTCKGARSGKVLPVALTNSIRIVLGLARV